MPSKYVYAACIAAAFGSASASAQSDLIPVVPASVMTKDVPRPMASKVSNSAPVAASQSPHNEFASYGGSVNNGPTVTMRPGVNQIIPIAIGHPNRIVTPFSSPDVTSTTLSHGEKDKCGEICIKDNVVYVATTLEAPVTMFITEKGSEAQALSLTMIPRKVPPREVFLKLDSSFASSALGGGRATANAKAEAWETSQPYIETIRSVFRKVALNEVPQGYTMTKMPPELVASAPRCSIPGMTVDFAQGQYMAGHNINVFIGVARNNSQQLLEFKESLCGNWNVAAITSWPLKMLEPGQRTEVYVAVKQMRPASTLSQRPSLIGGSK